VRFLDFKKVRQQERTNAAELFGTVDEPSELAVQIMSIEPQSAKALPATNGDEKSFSKKYIHTKEEADRIKAAIKAAGSMEEIARLEKDLAAGRIPV